MVSVVVLLLRTAQWEIDVANVAVELTGGSVFRDLVSAQRRVVEERFGAEFAREQRLARVFATCVHLQLRRRNERSVAILAPEAPSTGIVLGDDVAGERARVSNFDH